MCSKLQWAWGDKHNIEKKNSISENTRAFSLYSKCWEVPGFTKDVVSELLPELFLTHFKLV